MGAGLRYASALHTLIEVHIAAVSKRVRHSGLGFLRKRNPVVQNRELNTLYYSLHVYANALYF